MNINIKTALLVSVAAVPVVLGAETVQVNANGGVIPNSSTAEVEIVKGGEGGDITLAADETTIKTLTDSTAVATVRIDRGQELSLSSTLTVNTTKAVKLTLTGDGSASINAVKIANNATLNLSCSSVEQVAGKSVTIGDTSSNRGYLDICCPMLAPSGTGNPGKLNLATGMIYVHDGAELYRPILIGKSYSASCWQDGGRVTMLNYQTGGADSNIGGSGWAHYNLSGGELAFRGQCYALDTTGPASKPTKDSGYPCLVFEQTGGKTSGSSLQFPAAKYEKAMWIMTGGESVHDSGTLDLANMGEGATAALVLDGPVTSNWKYVDTTHYANSRANIVLNDGVLDVVAMTFGGDDSESYVSFNGGTIRTCAGSTSEGLFGRSRYSGHSEDYANSPDCVTIYEGGMKVDVSESARTIYESLRAPVGGGVTGAASLPTSVTFDGPPMVEIIGDGFGAVAYAIYDRETSKVTGLRVVSPGCNYTWAKAVYMRGYMASGNTHTVRTNDCTVAVSQTGGGLELLGGTLSMKVVNEYAGATILRGGTLRPLVSGAIPTNAPVYIADGATLDLRSASGSEVRLGSGAGQITGGSVKQVGQWTASADDLVAGNMLRVAAGSQGAADAGQLTIAAGSTFAVDDWSKLDKEKTYTLLTADYPIAGDLPTVIGMPGWKLKYTNGNKSICLRKERGFCLLFR